MRNKTWTFCISKAFTFWFFLVQILSFCPKLAHGAPPAAYGNTPIVFIPNRGQVADSVMYMVRANGLSAYFQRDSVTVRVGAETVQLRLIGASLLSHPEAEGRVAGETNFP